MVDLGSIPRVESSARTDPAAGVGAGDRVVYFQVIKVEYVFLRFDVGTQNITTSVFPRRYRLHPKYTSTLLYNRTIS
jgi:hypothetical protein